MLVREWLYIQRSPHHREHPCLNLQFDIAQQSSRAGSRPAAALRATPSPKWGAASPEVWALRSCTSTLSGQIAASEQPRTESSTDRPPLALALPQIHTADKRSAAADPAPLLAHDMASNAAAANAATEAAAKLQEAVTKSQAKRSSPANSGEAIPSAAAGAAEVNQVTWVLRCRRLPRNHAAGSSPA